MNPLAADLERALDPAALGRLVGLDLDDWQARVLRSPSKRQALLCARQVGKSTTAALKVLHAALYRPGSLSLLVAPTQDQSRELYLACLDLYKRLGRPIAAESESALRLKLENGSRIVSLPGNDTSVRGYSSVAVIVVDEAAFAPDALWDAIRPTIAVSGGAVMLLSTPLDREGFFAQAWLGEGDWERTKVTALESPRVPATEIEEARRQMADWRFRRDYLCEFSDTDRAAFRGEDIAAAFDHEEVEWWPEIMDLSA